MESDPAHAMAAAFAPPNANVEAKPDPTFAGPWRRWLARNIDFGWQAGLIGVVLSWVLAETQSPALKQLVSPRGGQITYLAIMFLVLIVDAFTHRLFGNTVGKELLGLRVVSRDGSPLSFGEHVGRNLRAWLSGFGLSIPFVAPITMAWQHSRVKRGLPASYDVSTERRVTCKPIGALRGLAGVVIYLVIVMAYLWVTVGQYDR
jgi:uncharacterized RDD family membrane protein YckC